LGGDIVSRPAYTLQELCAVRTALWETIERAEGRAERMPTSAEAIRRRAANIRSVRDKILDAMPDVDGRNYRG
jgi:hypothetical protein